MAASRPFHRAVVVVLVGLVLVAGCAGCATDAGSSRRSIPKAGADAGVWDDLLERVAADGTWPKDVTLDAFAIQFGGLPGVDAPDRDESVPFFADESVHWIAHYWDQLDDEQRAIAKAKVLGTYRDDDGGVENGAVGAAAVAGPGRSRPTESDDAVRARVERWKRDLESRLGVQLDLDVRVEQVTQRWAEGAGSWAASDPELFMPRTGGQRRVCPVRVGGAYTRELTGREQDAAIAHEVFHCFQAHLFPGEFGGSNAKPGWWVEGSAAYVGEAVTNGTNLSANWWTRYLTGSEDGDGKFTLSRYRYSAIGLYALAAQSSDIWGRLRAVLTDASTDPTTIFAMIVDPATRARWAPSALRQRSFGSEWDMNGPGITPASRTPASIVASPGGTPYDIGELANGIVQVEGSGDVTTVESVGDGRWHAPRGVGENAEVHGLTTRRYCMRDTPCLCPDGSDPGFGNLPRWPGADGGITVAVAGAPGTVATVNASSLSLDEYCRDRSRPGVGAGRLVITGAHPLDDSIACDVVESDMFLTYDGGSAVMPARTGAYERVDFGPVMLLWGSGQFGDLQSTWDVRDHGRQGSITGTAYTAASLGRDRFPFTAEWRCR